MNRDMPFNELPPLPPPVELETNIILKKTIAARSRLAELKGLVNSIPNPGVLINGIVLQEARLSSEIENIITTNDELYRAAADEKLATDPRSKEVLRYREALWYGFQELKKRPLSTSLFVEIAGIIKDIGMDIRHESGVKIINDKTKEIVYVPPEGKSIIYDKLKNLEHYMHADDACDPLIKLAVMHYQFEAIHPFSDGNGRTGRIINILYLVQQGLLDMPVLFLSHFILKTKTSYYEKLRQVTENGAWSEWVVYILEAIEITAQETQEKVTKIFKAMEDAKTLVQAQAKKIYSKDLIEIIFQHPYCKIRFLEEGGLAARQTASTYLQTLESIGLLKCIKIGLEKYYINKKLMKILSQ